MDEPTQIPSTPPPPEPQIDQAQLQYAIEQLRSQQNLAGGVIAGLVAALAGAAVWAGITVLTNFQIGWMAVGVGFLVGFAVRAVGKGVDKSFGIAGAILALLGCLTGNLLAVCGIVSRQEGIPFFTLLSRLNVQMIQELMTATFSPMDLLFYGIAVYESYRFSFRQVKPEDLGSLAKS
jgi:hypothetical protein